MNQSRITSEGTYTLLQERKRIEMHGFSCKIVQSTITEYCGAYSHQKIARPPEIEISKNLNPQQCLTLVNTEFFTAPDGHREKIKIGKENIIYNNDLGLIIVGDNTISCRGQPMKLKNNIIQDILQISQYKVTVLKEKFIVEDEQVETMSDHIMLPPTCGMSSNGCETVDRTFVWLAPESKCSLEAIRTVDMKEENGYLVDRQHKVLLKKGSKVPSPQGCPTSLLFSTEYPHLYLAPQHEIRWPRMTTDLDMAAFIRSRDDYLAFELEKKIEGQDDKMKQQICHQSLTARQDEIIHLVDDKFVRRNGDTVEHFSCPQKTGKIIDQPNCYEDIPIEGGFIKPINRLFTSHSAPRPCNKHYGLKVSTDENIWISLNPHIKAIAEPEDLPGASMKIEHEDLSTGGIYTDAELDSWKKHLEVGDYHQAVTKTISYGVCSHRNDCEINPSVGSFNLGILNPMAYNPLDVWTRIDHFISKYAAYICILALTTEILKCCIFITVMAQTVIRDGIEGGKAMLYLLCCSIKQKSDHINKRLYKMKKREKEEIMELKNPPRFGLNIQ